MKIPAKFKVFQCDEDEDDMQFLGFGPQFKNRVWQAQLENFREIIINENISDELVEKVVLQIFNINRHDDAAAEQLKDYVREPITMLINSNGGEIDAALSICAAMEMSRTPIHTVALGKALSAGFLILICGDTRYAQQYSRLMYHTGSSGYIGTIPDILEHGDYLESLNDRIHQMVIRHTHITEDQLDDVFARKSDWYFSIDDALNLGVIDGIWGVPMEAVWGEAPADEDPCEDCAAHADDPHACDECEHAVE